MPNYSILKSRTFWTVFALSVYNVLTIAGAFYPAGWITDAINALGLVLATYFHVNPSQSYNPPS